MCTPATVASRRAKPGSRINVSSSSNSNGYEWYFVITGLLNNKLFKLLLLPALYQVKESFADAAHAQYKHILRNDVEYFARLYSYYWSSLLPLLTAITCLIHYRSSL